MTDRYAQYLQDFDPFEGEPPDYRTSEFGKVLRQARKIVARRRTQEISQAVSDLDKAIEYVNREDSRTFMQKSYAIDNRTDFSYEYRLNEVFQRHYLHDKSDKDHFTPKECCAALAIAIVASTRPELHLRMLLREMLATSNTQREKEYAAFADKQLLLAHKALSIGKQFSEAGKTKPQQAADQQAARKQLKQQFVDFYLAGNYSSKSEAAREFHKKLPRQTRGLIRQTDENIVRFYTTALRQRLTSQK